MMFSTKKRCLEAKRLEVFSSSGKAMTLEKQM